MFTSADCPAKNSTGASPSTWFKTSLIPLGLPKNPCIGHTCPPSVNKPDVCRSVSGVARWTRMGICACTGQGKGAPFGAPKVND
jgi:hypothetical protein